MSNNIDKREFKSNCKKKETYQSFINALPYSAAILNKKGVIFSVNEQWKEFGENNELSLDNYGIGCNYIKISKQAKGEDDDLGAKAAAGIKAVISGEKDIFFLEYPCHSENEKRWFKMRAKTFKDGALVLHENITEKKLNEIKLERQKKEADALFENSNSAIARLDKKHRIIDINNEFQEKFGYQLSEIKNENLDNVLDRGRPGTANKNLTKEVLAGNKVKKEDTRYLKDGTPREFLIKGIPIKNNNDVTGIYAIFEDITALKRKEEKLDSIFNSSLDIGYVIAKPINEGKDAIIKEVSPGAINIFDSKLGGLPPKKDMVGESINQYFSEDMIAKMPLIHSAVENGQTITRKTRIIDKEGKTAAYVLANISAFRSGEKNKVISVFMDISELEQTKKELQRNRKNLNATLNSIGDAVIATDNKGYITRMNPVAEELTGYSFTEAKGVPLKDIFNIVNASTRKEVKNPAREVLENGEKVGLANHTVLIAKGGEEYQIADSAAPIKDNTDNIIGVVLVFRDVSEEYLMREKLKDSEERLQKILSVIPDTVSVQDKEMNIVYSNWNELADIPEEKRDLYSKCYKTYRDYDDICPDCQAKTVLETKQSIQKEIRLPGGDWYDLRAIPLQKDENGNVELFVEWVKNITERKKREERIKYISHHDSITDLYNRTYMEQEIIKIDAKNKLPVSIIMIDVNGLKIINEAYGHKKGDKVLVKTAEILCSCIGDEDTVARWAGDEFIILLPQKDKKQTVNIVKKIRKKTKITQNLEIPISFGLGYALKTSSEQDIYEILHKAENEVYKDKLTNNMSIKNKLVQNMLNTLGAKSDETKEHAQRMTALSYRLGERIGLSNRELNNLSLLATLHDVGKVNIAEEILTKPDSLTEKEWEAIKAHTEKGYAIASAIEEFTPIAVGILAHHERWDGDGYPQGLAGEEIPLLARIISIVDAYDVMTNGRPYKKPMSKREALEELKRCAGSQFDPRLVREFVEIIEK